MLRFLLTYFIVLFSYSAVFLQGERGSGLPLIIDADTANEVDDLYAIVRALVAPELDVLAISSAHFINSPQATDNTVMESQKLNEEIIELIGISDIDLPLGSNGPLLDESTPQISQAAEYIVHKAHSMPEGQRLQIAILGPCTNVASAILMDSTIVDKIVVSYIGFWHDKEKETWSRLEFNSGNDIKSVNVLLKTPNLRFNSMTATTSGQLIFDKEVARDHLSGRGGIKSYLFNRWLNHQRWWQRDKDPKKLKWAMWDVAIIEALINPDNATTEMLMGPEPNNGEKINVYTAIDVEKMKRSFWDAISKIDDVNKNRYLINDVNIIHPDKGLVTYNHDVKVEFGRVAEISETNTESSEKGWTIIEGKGHFLMPGLSEMHAHIPVPNEELGEAHVQDVMHLYLANGVTVIRGMLGHPYHLELKKKIRSGEIVAPRMYTSSPSMNGNSIPDIETAEKEVADAKAKGYDFLKIHPGIKSIVMEALVSKANEVGIGYAGHVPFDVGIRKAIEYKFETVDHVDGYIRGLIPLKHDVKSEDVGFFGYGLIKKVKIGMMDDLARATAENDVWQVPTQTLFTRWFSPISGAEMMSAQEFAYLPAKTRYAWRTNKDNLISDDAYSKRGYKKFMRIRKKIIQSLHQNGVRFLLGSDSPQVMNVPGFSIHHEIDALEDCGISPFDIVKMGTSNPAIFFEEIDRFGSIKVGADADFIIVEDNPFNRLETMKLPLGTMIGGVWLDRKYFNDVLYEIEQKHK